MFKTKMIRTVVASLACLAFVGVSGMASAGGWDDRHDREIHRAERRIDELYRAKARAEDRHNWREVRRIESDIRREREILRRERDRDRDHDRHHF